MNALRAVLRFLQTAIMCAVLAPSIALAQGTQVTHPSETVGPVEVDGITLKANITFGAAAHYGLTYVFSRHDPSRNDCLSSYLDVDYQLKDSNGTLIPLDPANLQQFHSIDGAADIYQVANPHQIIPAKAPFPGCRAYFADSSENELVNHAMLGDIYPNLAPGTYTLTLTFAPRGVATSAKLPPLTFTIDDEHPI